MVFAQFSMLTTVSADTTADFKVGVTGHNNSIYRNNFEDFIYYAAQMGSKIVRVDMTTTDHLYWDRFFALCDAYDLDVMGIVYKDEVADFLTKRYADQLDYLQMYNELDNIAIKDVNQGGRYDINYKDAEIKEVSAQLKSIYSVIKKN